MWYIPLRFRLTKNPFSFIFNLFHFNSHNDFSLFSLRREHYFLFLLHCVFSFNIGRRQANLNSLFYGVSGNTLRPTEDIKLPWREEARLHAATTEDRVRAPTRDQHRQRPVLNSVIVQKNCVNFCWAHSTRFLLQKSPHPTV